MDEIPISMVFWILLQIASLYCLKYFFSPILESKIEKNAEKIELDDKNFTVVVVGLESVGDDHSDIKGYIEKLDTIDVKVVKIISKNKISIFRNMESNSRDF